MTSLVSTFWKLDNKSKAPSEDVKVSLNVSSIRVFTALSIETMDSLNLLKQSFQEFL
jgi:hypothetical protein